MWDALPPKAKDCQHSVAQKLFDSKETVLNNQLNAFLASSQTLEDYPDLEAYLAPFSFVQVAERLIEAAHKDLGHARPKNFRMTMLSLNMRLPELDKFLALNPQGFSMLVDAFGEAREFAHFADMFPCHRNHPELLKVGRSKKRDLLLAFARHALYRDSMMQFAENEEAVQVQTRETKAIEHAHAQFNLKQKQKPVTEHSLVANLVSDCVRDLAWSDPGRVFSIVLKQGDVEVLKLFTPVLLQPSQMRRPVHAPCTLKSFQRNDIIVTLFENRGTRAKPLVSSVVVGRSEVMSIGPLVESMGIDQLLQSLWCWSKHGHIKYVLPLMGGEVSKLLWSMMQHGAFPKTEQSFVPPEKETPSMEALVSNRFAKETHDGGYLLTELAIQRMDFLRELGSHKPLASMGGPLLADMSDLQLLAEMRSQGWKWLHLPAKQQKDLSYKPGNDLLWYTSGVTVSRFYMMCLLDARRLAESFGINEIPHGQMADTYEHIFGGMCPKDAARKALQQKRKQSVPLALEADVDLADQAEAEPRHETAKRSRGFSPASDEAEVDLGLDVPQSPLADPPEAHCLMALCLTRRKVSLEYLRLQVVTLPQALVPSRMCLIQ